MSNEFIERWSDRGDPLLQDSPRVRSMWTLTVGVAPPTVGITKRQIHIILSQHEETYSPA